MKSRIQSFLSREFGATAWQGIKESRRRFAVYGLIGMGLLWLFDSPIYALVATVLLCGVDWLHFRYMRALRARMLLGGGCIWSVEVNQVLVDFILDSEYARIQHQVYSDVRMYVLQVFNVLRVVINMFALCIRVTLYLLLGFFLAQIAFWPEEFSVYVSVLQSDPQGAIVLFVTTFSPILGVIVPVYTLLHPTKLGYISYFKEAIDDAVRRQSGVAAVGSVSLFREFDVNQITGLVPDTETTKSAGGNVIHLNEWMNRT